MEKSRLHLLLLLLVSSLLFLQSCSHKFESDVLNLDFYQWNLWEDSKAGQEDMLPSCGWEDLHRGKGKLVRIPASLGEHFPDRGSSGVYWYHCRFTLPEQWEEQAIFLVFEEAGPQVRIYLNEVEVGYFQGKITFEVDVTEDIYYTRDNHLSIRISKPPGGFSGGSGGITGNILVKPVLDEDKGSG